ncbi:uncharacterized protein LOC126912402 [Spodoptera frugiperda]|uniref:Uncharacterized protein LOC126912402 n=1 Tax=Spodoptera frugiperda TaxID=7108 RepID=A0A9R0E767_SPOFR|nr:uncharacterized protein LOC126912402 [Spodoptera frugiperda]
METTQHQINISRRIRTQEYAMKYNKDALQDDAFSYRSDIITTSLYCACKDCIKFCCYRKPIKCIDPYLMDMRYTFWIYQGLVKASKTTTAAATATSTSAGTAAATTSSDEPKPKRRKC